MCLIGNSNGQWLPSNSQESEDIYRGGKIFLGWSTAPSVNELSNTNLLRLRNYGINFTHDDNTLEGGKWNITPVYTSSKNMQGGLKFVHNIGNIEGGFSFWYNAFDPDNNGYIQKFILHGPSVQFGLEDQTTTDAGHLWIKGSRGASFGGDVQITGGESAHDLGGKVIINGGEGHDPTSDPPGNPQFSLVEIGSNGGPVTIGSPENQGKQITKIHGKVFSPWLTVGDPAEATGNYNLEVTESAFIKYLTIGRELSIQGSGIYFTASVGGTTDGRAKIDGNRSGENGVLNITSGNSNTVLNLYNNEVTEAIDAGTLSGTVQINTGTSNHDLERVAFEVNHSGSMFSVKNNGNVGIGRIVPLFPLHVDGTMQSRTLRLVGDQHTTSSEGSGSIQFGDRTSHWKIKHDYSTGGQLQFVNTVSAPDISLALTEDGKVGIGTNDPIQKLDVAGFIKADGFDIIDPGNAGKIFSLNSSGQSEWIEPSSFVPTLNGQANSLAKFNGTGGVMESRIFDEQGTTDRVSVFAPEFLVSGQSTLQGVVQAQVVNISNTPISNPLLQSKQLQLGRDMSVHDFGNNGMIGKNWFWSGTGSERVTLNKGASQINMSEDGGIQMYTADDNDDLNTTGPRMVISNNGNIGVGTFDPVSALQVQRSVAGGTTFAENNLLQLSNRYNSDGGQTTEVTATFDNGELNPTGWKIGAGVTGNDYFRIRSFTNNTEIERMRIDNQGNVGIGVPAPSQRLDVDGTIRATGLILDNTNLTNGLAVLNNGILETLTNDELATTLATTSTPETIPMFGTNNLLTNSVIRQTPAGFVGINTINPVTTLDVNGVITATNLSLPGLNTTTGIRLLGIDETGQLVAPADPVLLTTLGGSGINATTGTGGRIAKYQGTGPDAA